MPLAEKPPSVRVRVPAKVNLHLSVGPVRDDGYHEVSTVYQAVDIYDEVTATASEGMSLTVGGDDTDAVPRDHTNLAWRAALLLAEHAQVAPDVNLHVHKEIPVAGGMAGGSADAAAALVACATLWRTGTSRAELADLAAQLGADVPFALTGGTALGTGRGEQLTPVLATGEYHWVFAFQDFGISAADAYAELDRMRAAGIAPSPIGTTSEVLDALRRGDGGQLSDVLANDLQPAALSLRPELRRVLDVGTSYGALGAVVSGSGPTCAFLCESEGDAMLLAGQVEGGAVCRTTRVASAPAAGARVVG